MPKISAGWETRVADAIRVARDLVSDTRALRTASQVRRGSKGYRCAWCGRVSLDQIHWSAPIRTRAPGDGSPRLSICPECSQALEAAGEEGLTPTHVHG